MDSFWKAQQLIKSFFSNKFSNFWPKLNFFTWIARREYWSKCNVLYINGFVSTSSTNLREAFFKFLNHFLNELHYFEIIVALGLAIEVGEAFVLISTRSSLNFFSKKGRSWILTSAKLLKSLTVVIGTWLERFLRVLTTYRCALSSEATVMPLILPNKFCSEICIYTGCNRNAGTKLNHV